MSQIEDFGIISETRGQFCFIEWKIYDFFTRYASADEEWESPKFHLSGATWYISLAPNSQANADCEEYISLFLCKEGPENTIHHSIFMLGIKSKDGSFYKCRCVSHAFEKGGYGLAFFKSRESLEEDQSQIAVEGVVTFFCIVHIIDMFKISTPSQTTTFNDSGTLCRDFKQLFLSEDGADVTIKVKDKELRAHSQILAARSSVLAPMFRHNMKEKNTGVVEIVEYEPESFREFLIFLYCGDVEKMSWDNVIDLYCAAEKYDVQELKTRCLKFMTEGISIDTFCDVLSLGIRYSDKHLINSSTEFFIVNSKSIIVTTQWLLFAKEYLVQANELFIKLLNRS